MAYICYVRFQYVWVLFDLLFLLPKCVINQICVFWRAAFQALLWVTTASTWFSSIFECFSFNFFAFEFTLNNWISWFFTCVKRIILTLRLWFKDLGSVYLLRNNRTRNFVLQSARNLKTIMISFIDSFFILGADFWLNRLILLKLSLRLITLHQ